jgi:hypothetical protein
LISGLLGVINQATGAYFKDSSRLSRNWWLRGSYTILVPDYMMDNFIHEHFPGTGDRLAKNGRPG